MSVLTRVNVNWPDILIMLRENVRRIIIRIPASLMTAISNAMEQVGAWITVMRYLRAPVRK